MNMDMSTSKTAASAMSSMIMSKMTSESMSMAMSSMSDMMSMSMASSRSSTADSMKSTKSSSMSMSMSSVTSTSSPTNSATSTSMGAMSSMAMDGMGQMSMSSGTNSSDSMASMNMEMNSYLTRKYKNYPVLFEKLHANNKGKAFGIFLLLVVAAFVYKFILFTSWCLEVHWFKKWDKANKYCSLSTASNMKKDPEAQYFSDDTLQSQALPNILYDFMTPSWTDLFHDFIRVLLVFCSTMLIYMLMLAAMSFVLTYVFGVILGLTLAEVVFNRWKLCMLKRWDIQKEIEICKNCPGAGNCKCGRHNGGTVNNNRNNNGTLTDEATVSSNDENTQIQDEKTENTGLKTTRKEANAEAQCNCETETTNKNKHIERNMLETARMQERSGDMDHNLLPAEKFT